MKKVLLIGGIILLLIISGIALYKTYVSKNNTPSSPQGQIEEITSNVKPEAVEILATDLEIPWSIDFLPDGSFLFTERTGKLKKYSKGNVTDISTIPDVKAYGEGGLMGLTQHPDFASNNYLYLMLTYSGNGDDTLNRVVRYKFVDNQLSDRTIIVDKIPGAIYHNGGRIKFGPDNYLYITTGDARNDSLAQNKNSLAGKILRATDDGSPAPGNPFNSLVYSYGHRNPQGITWDASGRLWETEHGRSNPTGYDEINVIEIGKNYGWPEIQGDETRNDMETPIINSGLGTWAPGSAQFYDNSLFFGGLKGEALFELRFENDSQILVKHFLNQFGRIRDVVLGPDNLLYITTSNRDGRGNPIDTDDRIIRIDPNQL